MGSSGTAGSAPVRAASQNATSSAWNSTAEWLSKTAWCTTNASASPSVMRISRARHSGAASSGIGRRAISPRMRSNSARCSPAGRWVTSVTGSGAGSWARTTCTSAPSSVRRWVRSASCRAITRLTTSPAVPASTPAGNSHGKDTLNTGEPASSWLAIHTRSWA